MAYFPYLETKTTCTNGYKIILQELWYQDFPIRSSSFCWRAYFVRQGRVNFVSRNCFELHDNTMPELCRDKIGTNNVGTKSGQNGPDLVSQDKLWNKNYWTESGDLGIIFLVKRFSIHWYRFVQSQRIVEVCRFVTVCRSVFGGATLYMWIV